MINASPAWEKDTNMGLGLLVNRLGYSSKYSSPALHSDTLGTPSVFSDNKTGVTNNKDRTTN